jgi:hypothetical protein
MLIAGIPNPGVARSNRAGGTNKIKGLASIRLIHFSLISHSLPILSPLFIFLPSVSRPLLSMCDREIFCMDRDKGGGAAETLGQAIRNLLPLNTQRGQKCSASSYLLLI